MILRADRGRGGPAAGAAARAVRRGAELGRDPQRAGAALPRADARPAQPRRLAARAGRWTTPPWPRTSRRRWTPPASPRAAVLGHSMGGKVAMALALAHPDAGRAPGRRRHRAGALPRRRCAAMSRRCRRCRCAPGLTRREADAALAAAIPEAGIRAFLLQNLRFEADPPRLAARPGRDRRRHAGDRGFRAAARRDASTARCWCWPANAPAISAPSITTRSARCSRARALRHGPGGRALGACGEPDRVPRAAAAFPGRGGVAGFAAGAPQRDRP